MYRIKSIEKRSELLEAFDSYGMGGFQTKASEEGNVIIRFALQPETDYILPLADIVFYAGYLPPKGKIIDKYAKDRRRNDIRGRVRI